VVRRLRGREGRIGICDESDCFGVQTVMQSRNAIRALAQLRDVEMLVQTVPSVPSAPEAKKDADPLGSQGVRVLIGKEDRVVRVEVALPLLQQGLTPAELARVFAGPLAANDFDASLRAGLAFLTRFGQRPAPQRR
jgi:hypothetical protein